MKVQCEWLNKKISIDNDSLQKFEFRIGRLKKDGFKASLMTRKLTSDTVRTHLQRCRTLGEGFRGGGLLLAPSALLRLTRTGYVLTAITRTARGAMYVLETDPMAFGEDGLRGLTSMYGYSIHMLPPTDTHRCQLATGNTRGLRNAPMSSASEKLSMPPSLHWYSLPLAG